MTKNDDIYSSCEINPLSKTSLQRHDKKIHSIRKIVWNAGRTRKNFFRKC